MGEAGPVGKRGPRGPRGPEGPAGEADAESVMQAIEDDPDKVREIVNDGGPTTNDICDEFFYSGNETLRDIWLSAC